MLCNPFVTLLIRHTLGALGGALIAKGWVDQSAVDQIADAATEQVVGALCSGGAVFLSIWDKLRNQVGK